MLGPLYLSCFTGRYDISVVIAEILHRLICVLYSISI